MSLKLNKYFTTKIYLKKTSNHVINKSLTSFIIVLLVS